MRHCAPSGWVAEGLQARAAAPYLWASAPSTPDPR